MKKTVILFFVFIIYTALIVYCPQITSIDINIIIAVQTMLKDIPIVIPSMFDSILYDIMLVIPLISFGVYFIKNKKLLDLVFILLIPILSYGLNCLIKPLIQRTRPPYDLQLGIHPESFSYVSSHSLLTFCLWAMVIYYTNKYVRENFAIRNVSEIFERRLEKVSPNFSVTRSHRKMRATLDFICKIASVKYTIIAFSVFWILFMGFSRIWLGVHYPSDVLGAYILAYFLISAFINFNNSYEKN